MNSTVFIWELGGAIVLGFLIGFVYTKVFMQKKIDSEIKDIKETINIKDNEYILLKKKYRSEHRKVLVLNDKIEAMEKELNRKIKQYTNLKSSIIKLKNNIKEKNYALKELEDLLLDIQKDYETLDKELENSKKENKELKVEIDKLKNNYKKQIELLTKKANDLYTIKSSDELKNAKEIFDKLRDNAINN